MNIPSKLFAGARWKWTESLTNYPASEYTLSITFKLGTSAPKTIDATADNDDFSIDEPASGTSSLAAGNYSYQGVAVNIITGEVEVIEEGVVPVEILLSAAGTTDVRTYWQKMVDLLKSAYEVLAEKGEAEVEINGRRVTYTDRAQLLKEIHNAEVKAGVTKSVSSKPILTRFTND